MPEDFYTATFHRYSTRLYVIRNIEIYINRKRKVAFSFTCCYVIVGRPYGIINSVRNCLSFLEVFLAILSAFCFLPAATIFLYCSLWPGCTRSTCLFKFNGEVKSVGDVNLCHSVLSTFDALNIDSHRSTVAT